MAQPSFDSILNAVMLAESGGRRYDSKGNLLTSDKGARGEMQVLDTTKFQPGFGVEPARADTPDERARVGRDYLRAMLDRYGDIDKALAAYNWGPGNTDKWIARGADPAKLPAETQGYISKIKSSLAGAPRTTAQAAASVKPEAAALPEPAAGAPRAAPVKVSEARPADLGASYQAALALSFLSDEDEKEGGRREYDERQPSVSSQWLARQTARVSPEMLAMPYRSPFREPEPVKAAGGGLIAVGYNEGGEVSAKGWKEGPPEPLPEEPFIPGLSSMRPKERTAKDMLRQAYHSARDFVEDAPLTPMAIGIEGALMLADRYDLMPTHMRQLIGEERARRLARRDLRRQGYEDGGEVDAGMLASKSEQPSRPEPFRVPSGQTEARLKEFNRLDPATRAAIMEEDPRVQFGLRPAPASVSLPYTLSTMPGARSLYDETLRGTTTYGYVVPDARMVNPATGKAIPTQDVVFLNPSRDAQAELKTRAHEAEHLLARRGLGRGPAINSKFDELIGDTGTRRRFVEAAVKMQPYLKKEYGLDSAYFDPKELAFQDRARVGHNLLFEQFAELAAIEQATGKDLTKDPELRKTIFKDKKVREVYNAMTGLRQTRLDARDLSPYTPIPEKPEGVMGFIRSKLGFADGGDVSAGSEEDILARAQAAAREGQAYRDMQEYLKTRGAVPDIEAGSLPSQTAAEFQRTILPVGAGTIKINRGRLTDRTRETLPATLTHELAHAVDRQISQQAAEQAGIPNQFTEAYRKLVGPNESRRADIARKLDPAWEKRNRSYRSSPKELAGHGMGAFVDNAAQTPGPGHVDATAATELAILMDLANRNVDKKPKGLEKIPAFLRGIGYAEGGEAKSEEPTAEELERASKPAFGIVPSSGKGRKQGRVSQALQSGEAQKELAKGLTMLPQNVVGAPVDIAALVARPFGYNVEKPVMGSEWLKEKSRAAGLAFQEPEDPTLRAFFTAGDIASNLINPAGATRTAVRGVEKTGQAAKELAEFATRPVERDPFFSGSLGSQRGAVRLPGGHFPLVRAYNPKTGQYEQVDQVSYEVKSSLANTGDKVLDNWLMNKVGAYLRRDLGTERDPFFRAAEEGRKTHIFPGGEKELLRDPDFKPAQVPNLLRGIRSIEGFPELGFAKTEMGRRVETASDYGVFPEEIQNYNAMSSIPPGLRQFVETNPTMRLNELQSGVFSGGLKLKELRNSMLAMRKSPDYERYGQFIEVPERYRLSDKMLEGMSPIQASERVAQFENWKTDANGILAGRAIREDASLSKKELPDKSLWLNAPDLKQNPRIRELVQDLGCDGGWCTDKELIAEDYGSGENRLAILMDPKNRPVAQLTVSQPAPLVKDFLQDQPEMADLFNVRAEDLWSRQIVQAIERSPQFRDWASRQPANMRIIEIKGRNNETELRPTTYVKNIQDYVKDLDRSHDLLSVDNLAGIGLTNIIPQVQQMVAGTSLTSAQLQALQKEAIRLNGGSKYVNTISKDSPGTPDYSELNSLLNQAYKNAITP